MNICSIDIGDANAVSSSKDRIVSSISGLDKSFCSKGKGLIEYIASTGKIDAIQEAKIIKDRKTEDCFTFFRNNTNENSPELYRYQAKLDQVLITKGYCN